jgi:hypothetical protein
MSKNPGTLRCKKKLRHKTRENRDFIDDPAVILTAKDPKMCWEEATYTQNVRI